jgi:two-component system response regulator PilR (NtrC family)
VHINGESGTGKEVVARVIHRLSSRAEKPFVPVNCGAIPSELVESEFFGHKKGSFSGATQDKTGLFQAAEGGVLFLDEIGDLPFTVQAKLLRAIQEKKIRPLGSTQEIPVDVRILSATHQDLEELVKIGSFRQDLLYRIKVVELRVPPLRERVEDIPLLAAKILDRISKESNMVPPFQFSSNALITLQNYPFDGNVRELQNILERTATVCQSSRISRKNLELPGMEQDDDDCDAAEEEELETIEEIISDNDEPPIDSKDDILNAPNIKLNPESEAERAKIIIALEQTGHNFSLAAKLLNMTRATLRYRIKQIKKSIILVAMAQVGGNFQMAAKILGVSVAVLREEIVRLWGDKPPKFKY